MATIKSYTDLEQSKKLSEILPHESADMRYEYPSIEKDEIQEPMIGFHTSSFNWFKDSDSFIYFPCWSLAALLAILPSGKALIHNKESNDYKCICNNIDTAFYDNPIDACVAMIERLNELKML